MSRQKRALLRLLEVRASSLNHARHCHGYVQLAGLHQSDTPATRSGSLVHEYIAAVFDWGKGPAGDKWEAMAKKWSPLGEPAEDLRAIADEFLAWLKEEYRHLLVRGHRTEMPMRRVYEAEGVALNGTADLVTVDSRGLAHLWDWKLYSDPSRLPPIVEDLQMAAYAVLLADGNQLIDRVVVRRTLVRQKAVDEIYFNVEALDVARRTIARVLSELAQSPGQYTASPRCSGCLLRRYCPTHLGQADAVPRAMAPYRSGPIADETQAAWLARALPAAQDLIDKAKDELRQWVMEHGAIRDGDHEWGPAEVNTRNLTAAAAPTVARICGADVALAAAGAPSRAKLKRILGDVAYADLMRQLDAAGLLEQRAHDRWEWRKATTGRQEVEE